MNDYVFTGIDDKSFILSREEKNERGEFVYNKTVMMKYENVDYCELFESENGSLNYKKKVKIMIGHDNFFLIDKEADNFWKSYKKNV